ncbi:hypothetical protein BCR42DRAFT_20832 [Absidia repens]|uniref:Uncharacterized protein n=1 Tax=Absidia repens TaxID=90262 RepID=A0A1X2J4L2_9FUNG|nr:hypothetical protein BCR42DRAFT_20832 [Absidia repens]
MAATSVLLLQNQYLNELSPFFTEDNYRTTLNIVETTYNICRPTLAMDCISSVLSIIDSHIMGSISRNSAVSKLLDVVVPAHQEKCNKALVCLIMKLPMNPIGEEMNESADYALNLLTLYTLHDNGPVFLYLASTKSSLHQKI